MRSRFAWLWACSTALVAGCGGEQKAQPAPTLPTALAGRLARDADAVAAALRAGDPCGSAARAQALQQRVIQALNRPGLVPAPLKEDLGLAVADLVDRTQSECAAAQPAPAPSPPTTVADGEGGEVDKQGDNGSGNGKRGKHNGHRGKADD
jgi:hypothetical protein